MFPSLARAGYVIVDSPVAGSASCVAASGYIYAGRFDKPSVLVYDSGTSTLVTEMSLLAISSCTPPAGVTSIATSPNGTVYVGTWPWGEIFSVNGSTGQSVGMLPPFSFPLTDTTRVDTVSAMIIPAAGQAWWGFRWHSNSVTSLYTGSPSTPNGATRISLPAETTPIITLALAGTTSSVIAGTTDTGANRAGRLFQVVNSVATRIYLGDSEVSAAVMADSLPVFATAPSGSLRQVNGAATFPLATLPETTIRALAWGRDRVDSVIFIGGDTNYLRRYSPSGGDTRSLGVVDTPIAGIYGLVYTTFPERVYGVARLTNGQSCVFYYDTVAPRCLLITFALDTPLQQPNRSDTFTPPLTRGTYVIRVYTDEKLKAPPTIVIRFSDGTLQFVPMTGSGRYFTGVFTIAGNISTGEVTITFMGEDDAGNVGTEIVSGGSFTLKDLGYSSIANNYFRPNYGEFMTVRYYLRAARTVTVRVYNLRGQMVVDLSPGYRPAGQYSDVVWRGRNTTGQLVASGVYIVHVDAGPEFSSTHKVMMVR